jgi:hypothetical protein
MQQSRCCHLLVNVGTARAFAAIPEATAQHMWVSALDSYARGGLDCAHGADAHNCGMVARAFNEFDAGTVTVRALTARLNDVQ